MKERYRYTDIGLIEYTLEDNVLKYQGKKVPNIEVFSNSEEAKMNYYISQRNELQDRKTKLIKRIQLLDLDIIELDSIFVFPDNPELKL